MYVKFHYDITYSSCQVSINSGCIFSFYKPVVHLVAVIRILVEGSRDEVLCWKILVLCNNTSILFNYYESSLITSFDREDPRSVKTVCLKCNSVRSLSRPIS